MKVRLYWFFTISWSFCPFIYNINEISHQRHLIAKPPPKHKTINFQKSPTPLLIARKTDKIKLQNLIIFSYNQILFSNFFQTHQTHLPEWQLNNSSLFTEYLFFWSNSPRILNSPIAKLQRAERRCLRYLKIVSSYSRL